MTRRGCHQYRIKDNIAILKSTRNIEFMVDVEDLDYVLPFWWTIHWYKKQYRITGHTPKYTILSRFLLNPPVGMEVDHINHNRLDNCRSNLRIVTRSQNSMNMRKKTGVSRYKGVSWDKGAGKWRSQIYLNRRNTYLGLFTSEVEAAIAYNNLAEKNFGEYAFLNNVLAE